MFRWRDASVLINEQTYLYNKYVPREAASTSLHRWWWAGGKLMFLQLQTLHKAMKGHWWSSHCWLLIRESRSHFWMQLPYMLESWQLCHQKMANNTTWFCINPRWSWSAGWPRREDTTQWIYAKGHAESLRESDYEDQFIRGWLNGHLLHCPCNYCLGTWHC